MERDVEQSPFYTKLRFLYILGPFILRYTHWHFAVVVAVIIIIIILCPQVYKSRENKKLKTNIVVARGPGLRRFSRKTH